MKEEKYLSYCPNCHHYDHQSGVCCYIKENVMEDPAGFVKYCDGNYLSLIKGRTVTPWNEEDMMIEVDEFIIPDMVTVFALNNYLLFQMAKNILTCNGIKFWSNAEYRGFVLLPSRSLYTNQISVRSDDEDKARKLLSVLELSDPYVTSNAADIKIKTFVERWRIWLIVGSVILVLILVYVFSMN